MKTFSPSVSYLYVDSVKTCSVKTSPISIIMIGLLSIVLGSSMLSLYGLYLALVRNPVMANWTPEMTIMAITSLVTIVTSSIIAVISALSKARIDEHKALSQQNLDKLNKLHNEIERNTALTEQAQISAAQHVQVVQETVEKVVDEQKAVAARIVDATKKMS